METDALALLIVFLSVSLFGFGILFATMLFLSRDTTRIPEILQRVQNIEESLEDLNDSDEQEETGWNTADGKYQADTFEELLTLMASDPNGPLSTEEVDAIKSIFGKIMGDLNNNHSDDDDQEPWKKK